MDYENKFLDENDNEAIKANGNKDGHYLMTEENNSIKSKSFLRNNFS